MKVNFRQGIVSYPVFGNVQQFLKPNGLYVDLNTDNGDVQVAFAHRQSNYFHVETDTVSQAWGPITLGTNHWLYWDINLQTGQRSFGFTDVAPTSSVTQPSSPTADLHWFDRANNIMKVYISGGFRERVRVFAAKYDGTTFTSLGQGVLNLPFAGTQVGLNATNFAGRIILDDSGKPIKRSTGEFFHTESQFFVSGSLINTVRLESNTITAEYAETVAAYQVVSYSAADFVEIATYEDTDTTIIALALEDGVVGDVRSVLLQGIATNNDWDWSTVGAPLWFDSGVLVEDDPHVTSPGAHPNGMVPVARVLSSNSIIFEQGLGGKGDRGPGRDYDIFCNANGTLGTSVPTVIRQLIASRKFTIQPTGHRGRAVSGPTGSNAVFTITVNGSSIGTVTFTTAGGNNQIQTFSLTQTTVDVGDYVIVSLTTADSNNILADVALTIAANLAV